MMMFGSDPSTCERGCLSRSRLTEVTATTGPAGHHSSFHQLQFHCELRRIARLCSFPCSALASQWGNQKQQNWVVYGFHLSVPSHFPSCII